MVGRVHGAATAARYANTELYGTAVSENDLPEGMTWRELTMNTLAGLQPKSKQEAAEAIASCISIHKKRASGRPMPDDEPDPQSGFCWKTLYIAAKIGGNKFDRQCQKMRTKALLERRKNGILE
jgi:predicted phosphoadenosine phosphosulfate sulfurtransferase